MLCRVIGKSYPVEGGTCAFCHMEANLVTVESTNTSLPPMQRAHKIEELQQNPHVEACWYFTGSREQFRLTGTALVVDKDTEDGELQKVSRHHCCATVFLHQAARVYPQCWPQSAYSLCNPLRSCIRASAAGLVPCTASSAPTGRRQTSVCRYGTQPLLSDAVVLYRQRSAVMRQKHAVMLTRGIVSERIGSRRPGSTHGRGCLRRRSSSTSGPSRACRGTATTPHTSRYDYVARVARVTSM